MKREIENIAASETYDFSVLHSSLRAMHVDELLNLLFGCGILFP